MRTLTVVSNAGDGAAGSDRRARTAFCTWATVFDAGASSSFATLSVMTSTGIVSAKKCGMNE